MCTACLVMIYFCVFLGESSVHGSPKTALALAGEDVILPCSFSNTATHDFPAVEWSKAGLQPDNIVLLYRDGCEDHAMKNAAFRYRTSLISKELKNGNISLRISNVQLSDAGTYQCRRLWSDKRRDVTAVELVVGTFSQVCLSTAASWSPKTSLSLSSRRVRLRVQHRPDSLNHLDEPDSANSLRPKTDAED